MTRDEARLFILIHPEESINIVSRLNDITGKFPYVEVLDMAELKERYYNDFSKLTAKGILEGTLKSPIDFVRINLKGELENYDDEKIIVDIQSDLYRVLNTIMNNQEDKKIIQYFKNR